MEQTLLSAPKSNNTTSNESLSAVRNLQLSADSSRLMISPRKINCSGTLETSQAYKMYSTIRPEFSPPKNAKIAEILKNAQQEDPTKLTFLNNDDNDGRTFSVDSSEAASFYQR